MLNAVLRSHWSIFGKNESCGQSCGSFTEVIYIQWFFVVVYLMTVGIENKGRALTISSYNFDTTTQIFC